MKTGVIDVGGGLRGSFASGVMDRCIYDGVHFDYGIGVSAGSANLAGSLAGQMGRNYVFYTDYIFRHEYISLDNFIRHHNYIDLDYAYSTLFNIDGENPLDYDALVRSGSEYRAVACNAITGEPKYFTLGERGMRRNDYDALKASCCVPIADEPYVIDGVPYVDGGLADPVPVEKALQDGCERIVLILTKPDGHIVHSKTYELCARWLDRRGYSKAATGMRAKYKRYNAGYDKVKKMQDEGRGLIIAPESIEGMGTLTKDKQAIKDLYVQGFRAGRRVKAFMEQK